MGQVGGKLEPGWTRWTNMEDKTSKMSQLEQNWSPEAEFDRRSGTMLLAPGVLNFRKDLVGDPTQLHPAGAPDLRLRQQPATALGDLQRN